MDGKRVGTCDDVLVGTVITLGYQRFESKHSEYYHTQGNSSNGHERDLHELAQDLLPFGKVVLAAAGVVHDDPLPSELGARDLDGTDTLDVPSDAEVCLPDLPMLKEDSAPDGGGDGIHEGVSG